MSGRITSIAIQQAKQDAEKARIELSVLKEKTAPRHLTAEQRRAMLLLLAKLRGHPVAFACLMMDGESCDYATEMAAFFLEAGCQVPEPIKSSLNDLPGYVVITSHGKVDTNIPELLAGVFQTAGIQARSEVVKEN